MPVGGCVIDPDTFYLDPDPENCPNLDPDPGPNLDPEYYQFERKKILNIFFKHLINNSIKKQWQTNKVLNKDGE